MSWMMQLSSTDVANKKPEVERACQDDKKSKDDFFEIHVTTQFLFILRESYGSTVGL